MKRFRTFSARTAPTTGARAFLRQVVRDHGYLPSVYGVLALSETALLAFGALGDQVKRNGLSPTQRHVVAMTVTRLNGAGHCMANHSATAAAHGMAPELIAALRSGSPIAVPALEALRIFTEALLKGAGRIDATVWHAFLAAGHAPEQAFEVLTGLTAKMFSNLASQMAELDTEEGSRHCQWPSTAEAYNLTMLADQAQTSAGSVTGEIGVGMKRLAGKPKTQPGRPPN